MNSIGADSTPAGSLSGRWQFDSSYSYFLPQWLGGTHEFKAGGYFTQDVYNKFQEARAEGTGGVGNDYLLYFSNSAPFEVLLYNSPFVGENTVELSERLRARQLADRRAPDVEFRPARRALQRAICRSSRSRPDRSPLPRTTRRSTCTTGASWAPRIGLSYPLTSDNRTVVKATYGRFNFALRASDSRTIRNFNKNDYSATRYRWTDLNGNRDFDYPGELGTFVATEGGSSTVFNPDIRQPRMDEATVHVEREISSGFSARVGYVYKRESGPASSWSTPPGPTTSTTVRSPTSTPVPTASFAPPTTATITYYDFDPAYAGRGFESFTYVNVPGYTDRFHNIEFGVDKRLSNRWQMRASYLATLKDMWIAGVPQTPNEEFFPKNETWDTTFRVSGSYEAPFGIQTAGLFEYQSGTPQARDALFRGLPQLSTVTLRMEPIGAQRLPAVKLLNVRAAKRIRLFTTQAMTLQFDLYNAMNANDATTQSVRSGPTYGRITAIIPPRVARLGVTYSF